MARMTDPTDALMSFQQAFLDGKIRLQRATLDPDLFVFHDQLAPGLHRLTYVRLNGRIVKVLVNAMPVERVKGLPCFQLGVAVPPAYRNQGLAKSTLAAALAEMENGLSRAGHIPSFYVEGIVGVNNEPSKRASAAAISPNPKPVTDNVSGLPALHYIRKIG